MVDKVTTGNIANTSELAAKVAARIRASEKALDQTVYAYLPVRRYDEIYKKCIPSVPTHECPSAACVAGWTVYFAGYPMFADGIDTYLCSMDGYVQNISEVARNLLQISHADAEYLFSETRTVTEVLKVLDLIARR